MHYYWDGHMGWMWLWWILVLLLIGWISWLLITTSRRSRSTLQGETPEEILKRRYAKGEIDKETFDRMRADLRS